MYHLQQRVEDLERLDFFALPLLLVFYYEIEKG